MGGNEIMARIRAKTYTALWEGADITLGRNSSDEGAEDDDGLHFDVFKSIDKEEEILWLGK
jgi:hypothetical protein